MRKKTLAITAMLATLLLLCACAGPSIKLAVDEQLPHSELKLRPGPLIAAFEAKNPQGRKGEAEIILDAVHVLKDFGRTATTVHRIWRINTPPGYRHLPRQLPGPPPGGKLAVHGLGFYDTAGHLLNRTAGLARKASTSAAQGSHGKTLQLDPPLQAPFYFELKYTVRTLKEQFPAAYSACFITREELPIFKSVFSLSCREPGKMEIRYDGLALNPKTFTDGDLVTYVWTQNGSPPLSREASAPPLSDLSPKICLSFNKDWRELTPALKHLLDELCPADKEMIAWAEEQTAGATGRLQKARIICQALQRRCRGVSARLNLALASPRAARQLFRSESLPDYELNLLFLALTRAVGLETFPALLKSEASGELDRHLPSISQFDCIAVVLPLEEKYHFFYPAERYLAPGLMPMGLEGGTALLLDGSPYRFIPAPANDATANVLRRDVTIIAKREGGCSVSVLEKPAGELASAGRAAADHSWTADARLKGFYGELESEGTRSADAADTLVPFELTYYLKVKGQPSRDGDYLVFPAGLFPMPDFSPLTRLRRREQPLLLQRRMTLSDTIHLKLPARYRLQDKPGNTEIRFDFGSYSSRWEIEFGGLVLKRELVLKKRRISPADYPRFRTFLERIRQDNEREIRFKLEG